MSRRIFTAGISKSKDKRYLQIGLQEGGVASGKEPMSLLFHLGDDKIDSAYNTISLIRASRDEVEYDLLNEQDNDQQEKVEKLGLDTDNQQLEPEVIMNQKTLCNSCQSPNDMEAHFCSKCGNKLFIEDGVSSSSPPNSLLESYSAEKEKHISDQKARLSLERQSIGEQAEK